MKMIGTILEGCPLCAADELCKNARIEPDLDTVEKLEAKVKEIRAIIREAREEQKEEE